MASAPAVATGEPLDEFSVVVRLYGKTLRHVLLAWGAHPGSVDDHLQEVFLRAWRARRRYDPCHPLWPWLLRIARNEYVDSCRRAKARPEATSVEIDDVNRPGASTTTPEDEWVASEQRKALAETLRSLPRRQRHVLVVTAVYGASYEAAALELGVTTAALKALVFRARSAARQGYRVVAERRGLDEPVAAGAEGAGSTAVAP